MKVLVCLPTGHERFQSVIQQANAQVLRRREPMAFAGRVERIPPISEGGAEGVFCKAEEPFFSQLADGSVFPSRLYGLENPLEPRRMNPVEQQNIRLLRRSG
eukprot:scaffold5907_cov134-Pinguiococcus_pyrenoidosus.AAC.1